MGDYDPGYYDYRHGYSGPGLASGALVALSFGVVVVFVRLVWRFAMFLLGVIAMLIRAGFSAGQRVGSTLS